MTITRETKVASDNFASEKDDLTKLTAAERYVMEAGSYLAYRPTATNGVGNQIVSMIPNSTDLDAYTTADLLTDFAPTENGLYVFRRVVDVAGDGTGTNDTAETFEYEGYYYDNGDFYKVEIESVTPDDLADNAGNNKQFDGLLSAATYSLFKDVTTVETPTLTYDATNNKLVATVNGSGLTVAQAQLALDTAGAAYDKAAHNYQLALAKQTVAVREDEAASADEKAALAELNEKKADEAAAKLAYDLKVAEYTQKKALYDTASTNLGTATTNAETALNALYGNTTNTPTNEPAATTQAEVTALSNGFYKTWKQAELDKAAALTDQEAFRQELRTWANKATTDGGAGKSFAADATIATMLADLSSADLVSFAADQEQHGQYAADAAELVAKKNYDDKVAEYNGYAAQVTSLTSETNTLKSAYEAALVELFGTGTNAFPNPLPEADTQAQVTALDNGLYKTWKQAVLDTASAQSDYNDAESESSSKSNARNTADADVAQKKAALDAAEKAFNDAKDALAGTGDIKINIKLSDDVVTAGGTANKWQLLPTALEDTTVPADGTKDTATFYYTSILESGETSAKLIDYVELDPSVTQDMYKYFDFDLNVALKSAQILYADDNQTILATAANGDSTAGVAGELDANATLVTPTDINTAINWTARP